MDFIIAKYAGVAELASLRLSAACGRYSEVSKGAAVEIMRSVQRANNFGNRKSLAEVIIIFSCKLSAGKTESKTKYAGVAELADAPDLGSGGKTVQVQVLSPAPEINAYL